MKKNFIKTAKDVINLEISGLIKLKKTLNLLVKILQVEREKFITIKKVKKIFTDLQLKQRENSYLKKALS